MLKVKVGRTEPVESAFRRLVKKIQRAGVIAEKRKRQFFESRKTRNMKRKAATIRKAQRKPSI